MPPFGLIGGSLLVIALALWYDTSFNAELQEKQSEDDENQVIFILFSIMYFKNPLFLTKVFLFFLTNCMSEYVILGLITRI